MKKLKKLKNVVALVFVSFVLIKSVFIARNTFLISEKPTEEANAFIVSSDYDAPQGGCLHTYLYNVQSKVYQGSFKVQTKDCKYKHKHKEKIIIKYLIDRPWVSRYNGKYYQTDQDYLPDYVEDFLKLND